MAHPFPNCRQRFFDAAGDPLSGGKVYTYYAGTTTPFPTYTDSAEVSQNTNPIILDSEGYCDMWLSGGVYKVILKTSLDVTLWTKDNISVPGLGPAGEYERNNFTGDGTDTTFTLSFEVGNVNYLQVYIDGVYQHKSTYSVLTDVITFTEAPPNNSAIEVLIGRAIDIAIYAAAEAAATALAAAAAASATNAATSATTASTQATNATTSATNAATSATTASTQATNAATSATTASTQATNAATSATNAATSATAAAGSATSAATSATNAAISAASATMTGPVSSTDNAIARWNGTTGQAVQNSSVLISDTGGITNTPTDQTTVALKLTAPNPYDANLFEIVDSLGTVVFKVNRYGNVVVDSSLGSFGFSNTIPYFTPTAMNLGVNGPQIAYQGTTDSTLYPFNFKNPSAYDHLALLGITVNKASNRGLVVNAIASQTANLVEVRDSAAAILSGWDKDGVLFALERASAPASPVANTHKLYVNTAGSWFTVNSSGVTKALGGGGGVGAIRWYLPDSLGAAREVLDSGLEVFSFTQDTLTEQRLFGMFTVPASYIAGTQMFLKKGKAYSVATSGNFLFKADTYIFKQDIDATSTPAGYASTNAQQAIDASANEIRTVGDIDLTTNTGTINAVAVAAGDTILIRLRRASSTETSQVNNDVKLLSDSFELVTS